MMRDRSRGNGGALTRLSGNILGVLNVHAKIACR